MTAAIVLPFCKNGPLLFFLSTPFWWENKRHIYIIILWNYNVFENGCMYMHIHIHIYCPIIQSHFFVFLRQLWFKGHTFLFRTFRARLSFHSTEFAESFLFLSRMILNALINWWIISSVKWKLGWENGRY